MRKNPLSVHGRILDLTFVKSTVGEYDHGLVIQSLSILKFPLIIRPIVKNGNSKPIRQPFSIKISLIICLFGWYVPERFSLNIYFLVRMQFYQYNSKRTRIIQRNFNVSINLRLYDLIGIGAQWHVLDWFWVFYS